MRELIKQYLDRGISRRNFLSGLGAAGITTVAANSMASSLAPFMAEADDAAANGSPAWMQQVRGTGGALLAAQLKAAGIEHIFVNPSSGQAPFFDALVDEPGMHLIKGLPTNQCCAISPQTEFCNSIEGEANIRRSD